MGNTAAKKVEQCRMFFVDGKLSLIHIQMCIRDSPSIVVDTHVKRVSNLLGLTKNQDPVKIEFDLMKIVPKDKWIDINTQMIAHGRKICIARRPKCAECFLFPYCTGGQALQKKKS